MKKLFILALALILQSSIANQQSLAQAPKLMNYQGVARDINGQPLADKQVSLRLSIVSAVDITNAIYTEEQTVKTSQFGLFALKIGEGNPIKGSMEAIDWGSADHFIAIELDADNNGHFILMGTSQLLSVPYAFYAEKAGTAKDVENLDQLRAIDFGGTAGQTIRHNGSDWEATSSLFHNAGNVGVGTTSPSAKLDVDGSVNLSTGNEFKVNGTRALALNGIQNVMIGHQAGNSVTTGDKNLFIGWQAGRDVNTGENNTMLGYRAGFVTTDGRNNNMIGNLAGFSNTIGNNNSFIGYRAGYSNTTGLNNYYAGTNAGHNGTTGLNNLALGTAAGFSLGAGSDNTLIGRNAGYNTTGDANVFIGKEAGITDTSGANNTYIGTGADGSANLTNAAAFGANASVACDSCLVLGNASNVGVGTSSPGYKLHLKDGNMMVEEGMISFSNSKGNTYVGGSAGGASDGEFADENVAVGQNALSSNTNGYSNVAVGSRALNSASTGNYNVAVGKQSLYSNTTGSNNVSIGSDALYFGTTGNLNVAIGRIALFQNTTGSSNMSLGFHSLYLNTTGSYNVAMGEYSMQSNKYGNENTAIGYRSNVLSDDLINATAIGARANVGCDSCLVLGNASNVGIGTTTPAYKLDVPSSTSNEVVAHFGQANIANKGTLNFHIMNDNLEGYNVGFGQNSGGLTTIGSYNHDIEFFTDSAATKEVMRIYNDGRAYVNYDFGFGTNNPGLQVSIGTSGTGIENDGSNNLQIYNSGAENARFTSTGNLGIGTTNPRAALHVTEVGTGFSWSPFSQTTGIFERATGSLLTIVSSNTGVSSVVMGDADSQFNGRVRYEHTDDRMEFWTANSEKVSILSNGNVGIGSNTPAEKLDIAGSIRMVDGNQQAGYIPVSDANGTMAWTNPNSITSAINDADSDTKIQVEESADEDKIRFDIAGAENFRMEGNSFYLNASSSLVSPTINFYNSSLNFTSSIASTIANPPTSNASYYLQFNVKGSNALRLDGNGAVTISGDYTLPTTDGADGEVLTTDGSGSVSWAFPLTMADADNDTKIQVEESADEDMIRFDLAGSEALVMRSNANGYTLLEIPISSGYSTFLGYAAGETSVSSDGNTFIGCFAGRYHTDGDFNTTLGASAGREMISTANNTLLGAGAGMRATASNNNTLIGAYSGYDVALGGDNVMIGYRTGYNTEGEKNIFIGYSAGENETGSQKLYIENSTSSSPLIYGEFDNDILAFNANVGIGTASPSKKLDVNGNAIVNGELDVDDQLTVTNLTSTDSIKVGSGGTVMTEILIHSVAYDLPNMDANSNIIHEFSVPGAEVGDLVFVSPDGKLDESVVIAACWVKETDVVEVKFRNTDDANFGNGEVPERNYRFMIIKL